MYSETKRSYNYTHSHAFILKDISREHVYGTVMNLLNNRHMDTIIGDKMFPGTHVNTLYSLSHTHTHDLFLRNIQHL